MSGARAPSPAQEVGARGPAGAGIARGLAFLRANQRADGRFPTWMAPEPTMSVNLWESPCVFPTALIGQSLAECPDAADIVGRVEDFLLAEMIPCGLWRHPAREHPPHRIPPDCDDTAVASELLRRGGRAFPANARLLIGNRNADGLFLSWIVPRWRWRGFRYAAAVLPQLLRPRRLHLFFKLASATPDDLDAIVNANVLAYLGPRPETASILPWLLAILREDREDQCDKWYMDAFAVWYFFSRVLVRWAPEGRALIAAKLAAATPVNPLQAALAVSTHLLWDLPVPGSLLDGLLAAQDEKGAWPTIAFYHGGRSKDDSGELMPLEAGAPHWGSEALTTGFAVEALSRLVRTGSSQGRA